MFFSLKNFLKALLFLFSLLIIVLIFGGLTIYFDNEVFFKMKPLKLQDLEIGYKREVQNFNADLVDKEIAFMSCIIQIVGII